MTKTQILKSLKASKWEIFEGNCWKLPNGNLRGRAVELGPKYIYFGFDNWPRLRYESITPELWTELTGIKVKS